MRDRLTIGEMAKLAGVTTKTVRHYHKVGLLAEPDRSEAGYRLYGAGELLRLRRIRQLKAFGLSLKQIENVLGNPEDEKPLREAFSELHKEISAKIEALEERRRSLRRLLAQENLEVPVESSGKPYALELAEKHLGEHLSEISPELWDQEKRLWASLDAFDWPEGYREMQELIVFYYADHPEEYEELIGLSEKLANLVDLPEDSPEVEEIAEDLSRHLKRTSFPNNPLESSPLISGAMGEVFGETLALNLSPSQRRVIELAQRHLEEEE